MGRRIVDTSLFFLVTLCVACALPLALGLPVAVRLGVGQGAGKLGFAAAIGMAIILIACRAVQMWFPIGMAAPWMALGATLTLAALWAPTKIRRRICHLWRLQRRSLVAFLGTGMLIVVLINVPILVRSALQFEGSRNADSFTFTSNARYMIGHAFFGEPDFSPDDPVYSISRSYFGSTATQPRPAAEGYLAWLSALSGKDPLYLYNAVQGAGLLLAGLSVLTMVRLRRRSDAKARPWLMATTVFACPALVYMAINSNFANNLNLAPATAYVALVLVRNTRTQMILGVLFVASVLGGYPELLVFIVACRMLAVLIQSLAGATGCIRKVASIGAELLLGCIVVPWAAKAAFVVYATTLGIGGSHDSSLHGDITEGVPLFLLALGVFALCLKRRRDVGLDLPDASALYAATLVVFAAAQVAMLIKGFAYGGFRLSGYFVTLHLGALVGSAATLVACDASGRTFRALRRALMVAVAVMTIKTGLMIEKSWRIARQRHVSSDLIALGKWLDDNNKWGDVLVGPMPQPFYHGMWINYVTSTPLVYDFSNGDAAGYLSPYLKSVQRRRVEDARLIVTTEEPRIPKTACDMRGGTGLFHVLRTSSDGSCID
jgi:hypothetical protein